MDSINKIEEKTNNNLFNLILKKISIGKKVLVLLNTKKKCENYAKKFFEHFEFMNTNEENMNDLISKITNTKNFPTEKCVELSKLIKRRIAYYHSEILQKQKDLIIENFIRDELRVLFTTNSFGSSFTFDNCCLIIENYKKFTTKKESYMSFFDYYQIYSSIQGNKHNEVVILENDNIEKVNELYYKKNKDEIFSKLSVDPILKKYVLYLVSFGFVNLKDELIEFFQKYFLFISIRRFERN